MVTGFYCHPIVEKRRDSWNFLSSIQLDAQIPLCVTRDLNEINSQAIKMGGKQREERLLRHFGKVLEATYLYDLGCKGDGFTWSNRHSDATFTKERFDCALANSS